MVAEDVKYSIERAINPATQGPGGGFFGSIAGFEDYVGGKTPGLSGIEVVDAHTVRFTLSRPDATFLHVMAINFAHVVPKEAVEQYGADFGKHPVGTGAYKLKEWTLGQRLVLERNPDYYKPNTPHLDEVVFDIGVDPLTALLRFEQAGNHAGYGCATTRHSRACTVRAAPRGILTGSRIEGEMLGPPCLRIVERECTAAAKAGLRHVHDRQREARRDCRVHGVPAHAERRGAGSCCIGMRRGYHATVSLHSLPGHRRDRGNGAPGKRSAKCTEAQRHPCLGSLHRVTGCRPHVGLTVRYAKA
jgi:hypothetical protein